MAWRRLGAALLLAGQMLGLAAKALLGCLLPAKLRDLASDCVLITGGGRGIGRALAREFARRGARKIILWGRTEKCLKEATQEIRAMGTECHYFVCDVGNREEVYQQAKAVREKVGDVTILVNNAAVVHGKSLVDSDDHALLKSQHINALGQFWTTKAFLPRMLELQKGHIVCLNSVLALSAIPGAVDYCTSKASSFAFMESLTLGLLDCPGVNATTVLPFHTSTEMFQGMRIRFPNLFPPLKPEMVARRTVEAVQQNQAFLLLPWTMHILVVLKRHTSFWIPTSNRWRDLMFPSSSRMLVFLDGVFFAGRNPACRSAFASLSKHLSTSGAGRNPQVCWELHLYEDFQRTDLRVAGNQDLVGPCQGWDPALVGCSEACEGWTGLSWKGKQTRTCQGNVFSTEMLPFFSL